MDDFVDPRFGCGTSSQIGAREVALLSDRPITPTLLISVPGLVEAGMGRSADPPTGDFADTKTTTSLPAFAKRRGEGAERGGCHMILSQAKTPPTDRRVTLRG